MWEELGREALDRNLSGLRITGSVIGLTGEPGGWLGTHADLSLRAPARETYRVQEYHLPIYHAICREVEEALFLE